jgi:nitrite reductase/ring-hydroxylating ferredoxin subunit
MRGGNARDSVVCREEDLPPGAMVLAPIGKFGVGVYNVDGQLYALTNYCPHMGGPLCLGAVRGTTVAQADAPGEVGYVLEDRVVRCPWHQWEFDITTGKTIAQPPKGIRTYPVRVEAGEVIVRR